MAHKESKKQIYVFADWKEFDKPGRNRIKKEIIGLIKKEIKKWNSLAKKYKVAKEEQEYMSKSFLCG